MKKLSSELTLELTWLSLKQLQSLLIDLHDHYDGDRFMIIKHISSRYDDTEIKNQLSNYINKTEQIK